MKSFKLKQIGLALCLMVSLLAASPSACTCSHHEETKAVESDCHSHHELAETTQESESFDIVDDECICVVNQSLPYVISKSASKEFRSNDTASNSGQIVPDLKFAAIVKFGDSTPAFTNDLLYSNTLKPFLPARAPPRQ